MMEGAHERETGRQLAIHPAGARKRQQPEASSERQPALCALWDCLCDWVCVSPELCSELRSEGRICKAEATTKLNWPADTPPARVTHGRTDAHRGADEQQSLVSAARKAVLRPLDCVPQTVSRRLSAGGHRKRGRTLDAS